MKRIIGFGIAVVLCALASVATAQTYSNSLGINFSRGIDANESDPENHGALADTTADGFVTQTHWNNLNVSDPAAPVYLAPTVDALGDAVPAPGVSFTSIEWVMPTVDVYPKHGLLYPDQTLAAPNSLGYIGLGDFYDDNQMALTITDIPYTNYDVAVLEGWFENGVRWHLFKGNDANTWSGQDALFGNTFTGAIVGSTFTFNGGADSITLTTGSASITMKKDGTIQIRGEDITVSGSGKIGIKASSDVTIKGSKIAEN